MLNRVSAALMGFVVGVSLVTTSAQTSRTYANPRSAANPANATQPPFSGAVIIGNTAYLSGVLGAGDTAEAAATAGLNSIQASLKAAGMTMDDLVTVQVFCTDVKHYATFNDVYRTYFTKFPARAFIGSGPLLGGARFEVQGIAEKR